MPYPSIARKNSLRYLGHDYAQPGTVFITVCIHNRQPLLGWVSNGDVVLSAAGSMVADSLTMVSNRFPTVELDAWTIMPDHLHAILHMGADLHTRPDDPTVGNVVRWLKSTTVEGYRRGVSDAGWEPYDRHLWQRNFHDRIVRTDAELESIRTYIDSNPARWWQRQMAEATP